MPRKTKIGYWTSRKAFGCNYKGYQYILAEGPDDSPEGETYRRAVARFLEITALHSSDGAQDQNLVGTIVERYLEHISLRQKPRTYTIRRYALQPFVTRFGRVKVSEIARHQVESWLDSMRTPRPHPVTGHPLFWTNGSIRTAITSIAACFNWAVKGNLISRNPLGTLPMPPARSRGRAALIGRTPEERRANHAKILAAATRAFRPLLVVLEATGARIGELIAATADAFDPVRGAIVYFADTNRLDGEHAHKSSQHKDRVILLDGEALEIVRKLVQKHRSGPLFRTKDGKRGWNVIEVSRRLRTIGKKIGLPNLKSHNYRHTFCTAWLERGGSIEILAELAGNTPNVLRRHYSHLLANDENLRRQLTAFRAVASECEQTEKPSSGGTSSPKQ